MSATLPERLIAWYGDDFTGSTDVMEALAVNGIAGVLFVDAPRPDQLERFAGYRAIGIAGISRSQNPEWMSEHLPGAFGALGDWGAAVVHYKTCSTFDSGPRVGSIGRAIDLGAQVFGAGRVPLIVGAPALRRYVAFGNLFAVQGGAAYRIDRHPTMSQHPVTPMDEADLRLHLGRQTARSIGLVDLAALESGRGDAAWDAGVEDVVLFDTVGAESLAEAGRIVWERRCRFIAGSSGVEYALIAHWRRAGLLCEPPEARDAGEVARMAAVSGSCSPVTESQIRWATAHGWAGVALDPVALIDGGTEVDRGIAAGVRALEEGRPVVLYTSLGQVVEAVRGEVEVGQRLGAILDALVRRCELRRAMVCGGDTSSFAARVLGIEALTYVRPTAPGSPLCRAWSADGAIDGLEIALKGGQVGGESYFDVVRKGKD